MRATAHGRPRSARRRAAAICRVGQAEARLPRSDQFQIHLGEQFGIEQGAVLGAPRVIDLVTHAKIVEPVRAARMLAASDYQRVDQPIAAEWPLAHTFELGIDEAKVEHRDRSAREVWRRFGLDAEPGGAPGRPPDLADRKRSKGAGPGLLIRDRFAWHVLRLGTINTLVSPGATHSFTEDGYYLTSQPTPAPMEEHAPDEGLGGLQPGFA